MGNKEPKLIPVPDTEEMKRKRELRRKIDELSTGEWSITEQLLQEVQANDEIAYLVNGTAVPPLSKQIDTLKELIEVRFKEEENSELRELLLDSVPHYSNVRQWTKKKGWRDAVFAKMETSYVFSNFKKARILETLFELGAKGNVNAAKTWLQAEGLLDNKSKSDATKESTYDRLNKILHNKK